MVVFIVHEMDGAARLLCSGCQNRFMDAQSIHSFTTERWQESRMNVEHAVLKVRWNQHVLEEPAHYNVFDVRRAARTKDRFAERFSAERFVLFYDQSRNLCGFGKA